MSVVVTEVEYKCGSCGKRLIRNLADKAHIHMFVKCPCGQLATFSRVLETLKRHPRGGKHA